MQLWSIYGKLWLGESMGAIKNLNVAIFGSGSIGCYLGGYLMSAKVPVTFIGRERVKWDLDMKGMRLTHYKRRPIHIQRAQLDYRLDYEALSEADIILVCVKSQDSLNAGETISTYAKPDALLVSFQNGVANTEILSEASGRQTLAAVVPFNVTQPARAEFHCGTEGDLIIQADDDKRLASLLKGFKKSGMGAKTVTDIVEYQWGKLLVNLNNALSALSGGTLREGLSQRSYRQVLANMMEEGLNICRGADIQPKSFGKASVEKTLKILRMPNFLFTPVMNSVLKIDENARSSMLDDLEGGRGSEINFLQGEIVRLADQTAQLAPINSVIMEEVHKAFVNVKSPNMTGDEMLNLFDSM